MFDLEAKALAAAINAAKQLKADVAVLYAGKHGVLFGTRSDAGTFLTLLSKEKQGESAVTIKLEDLTTATHRVAEMQMDIKDDHIILKPKKIRSHIRLAAEPAKTGDMMELWDSRNNGGNSAPMLTKMLAENRDLFTIRDHVGDKPLPVHIRWSKEGVAAGMSDNYHGVSVRTNNAPTSKKNAREVFVYSSWLPLLIDYLAPPETNGNGKKTKDKTEVAPPREKALLSITENNVSVSTPKTLLVLQAIVPGAETVTLDEIGQLASAETNNKLEISMADCNAALKRSLAVLPKESAVRFSVSEKKPELLRIEGVHDSGSRIVEELKTTKSKKSMSFSSTVYNLLDVTNACVPSCKMARADKAILFSYDYASRSDTVYSVRLFAVVIAD